MRVFNPPKNCYKVLDKEDKMSKLVLKLYGQDVQL